MHSCSELMVFNSCMYLEIYLVFFPLVCMHDKSLKLCVILSDTMDCRLPCSSVHGTSQARILEEVAISFSRGSSQPKDQTHISSISPLAGGFFTTNVISKALFPWFIDQ